MSRRKWTVENCNSVKQTPTRRSNVFIEYKNVFPVPKEHRTSYNYLNDVLVLYVLRKCQLLFVKILYIFQVPYLKRKKSKPYRITFLSVCLSIKSLFHWKGNKLKVKNTTIYITYFDTAKLDHQNLQVRFSAKVKKKFREILICSYFTRKRIHKYRNINAQTPRDTITMAAIKFLV